MFQTITPMHIVAFIIVLFAWIAMMVVAVYLVARVITRNAGGGMSQLLAIYSVPVPPDDYHCSEGKTVQVGSVVIKRCARLGIGSQGLYLKAPWRKAMLIPWSEVREVVPTTLYHHPAISLVVGEPLEGKLTVYSEDFDDMRSFLNQRRPNFTQTMASAVV